MKKTKVFLYLISAALSVASLSSGMEFLMVLPKANSCDLEVRKVNGELDGRCRVGATCSLPMSCDEGVDTSVWPGWNVEFCMCDFGTGEPPSDFICYPGGFKCITMIARQGEDEQVVCFDCECAESWSNRGLEQEEEDCKVSEVGGDWSTRCVCPEPPGE
jgi:hypothetical protein